MFEQRMLIALSSPISTSVLNLVIPRKITARSKRRMAAMPGISVALYTMAFRVAINRQNLSGYAFSWLCRARMEKAACFASRIFAVIFSARSRQVVDFRRRM
jgi:hypothetical protein